MGAEGGSSGRRSRARGCRQAHPRPHSPPPSLLLHPSPPPAPALASLCRRLLAREVPPGHGRLAPAGPGPPALAAAGGQCPGGHPAGAASPAAPAHAGGCLGDAAGGGDPARRATRCAASWSQGQAVGFGGAGGRRKGRQAKGLDGRTPANAQPPSPSHPPTFPLAMQSESELAAADRIPVGKSLLGRAHLNDSCILQSALQASAPRPTALPFPLLAPPLLYSHHICAPPPKQQYKRGSGCTTFLAPLVQPPHPTIAQAVQAPATKSTRMHARLICGASACPPPPREQVRQALAAAARPAGGSARAPGRRAGRALLVSEDRFLRTRVSIALAAGG